VIALYTPVQNGSAERRNRTLIDMTRSMLKLKNVPNTLRGEAMKTVTYIMNIFPKKKLDKIPEEVWMGRKQSAKHLRVFGSLCYKHVSDA